MLVGFRKLFKNLAVAHKEFAVNWLWIGKPLRNSVHQIT